MKFIFYWGDRQDKKKIYSILGGNSKRKMK